MFFAINGIPDVTKYFEIYQAIDIVFACEALYEFVFMLVDAALEVVSHTSVECAAVAGEDVDEVLLYGGRLVCLSSSDRYFWICHSEGGA